MKDTIKIILITVGIFILILFVVGLFMDDDNSSSSYGRYGRGYEYDRNVDSIADAYGANPDDVNDKLNRVANAMK